MSAKSIIYVLLSGFLLASCADKTEVERYLDVADRHMDEHPELALEALEAIDAEALTTQEKRAKFALLYAMAMALDQNYIDVASDTKFIEERYDSKLKSLRQSFSVTIITLSLVVIILILIIIVISQHVKNVKEEKHIQKLKFNDERRAIVGEKEQVEAKYVLLKEEKQETELMLASLKTEIEQLKKIRNDRSIDKEIMISIEQRLNVLNKFILAKLSDSYEKIAYAELEKLMDNREEFLESTMKIFMISHPKLISYLRKRNLTEWEIGCCCLYCIGFNGAEISEYLNRKAIYNVNSTIRQKLDIPKGGTQIDRYLNQKMREFHQ